MSPATHPVIAVYLVTPVRNAVRTIDHAIWSIVSQGGGIDIHYHVQDGGSDDGTLQKLASWERRLAVCRDALPSRVHFSWASTPDKGMYDAICRGVSCWRIPAEAVMGWCNADDALWPGALDSVVRLMRDLSHVRWVIGWPTSCDDSGCLRHIDRHLCFPRQIIGEGLADGIHSQFVQQESCFWRKSLWDDAGGYVGDGMRLAGDWDLWRRFARHEDLVHVQRQLGAFWVRPNQQSENKAGYRAEMDAIVPLSERKAAFSRIGTRADLRCRIAEENKGGQWEEKICPVHIRRRLLRKLWARLPYQRGMCASTSRMTKYRLRGV